MKSGAPDSERLLGISSSRIHGLGVFAQEAIAQGSRIIEYTGEIISDAEADCRYDDRTMDRHQTFLFSLADGRCIDGAVGGNDARFMNHSCDPNCEAVEVNGRIWIETIRPIALGEELTYDYGYKRLEGDDALASFYGCRCGASICRNTILAPQDAAPATVIRTSSRRGAPANSASRRETPK